MPWHSKYTFKLEHSQLSSKVMACEVAYSFLPLFPGDGGGQPWHPTSPWGQGWADAEMGIWFMGGGQDQAQHREPGSDAAWDRWSGGGTMAMATPLHIREPWMGPPWLRWCWASPKPPKSHLQDGNSPYRENLTIHKLPSQIYYCILLQILLFNGCYFIVRFITYVNCFLRVPGIMCS